LPPQRQGDHMWMSARVVTVCCLFAWLSTVPAEGTVVPPLDLPSLCDRADAIIVGQVLGRQEGGKAVIQTRGGPVNARAMAAVLGIQKLVKGQVHGMSISVRFWLPDLPIGYKGLGGGQFGVFFLRQTREGNEVLDPYHPFVVAVPGAPRTVGDYLDQVTAELAYAATSPAAPQSTRQAAIRALDGLRTPASSSALKRAATDTSEAVRTMAIAALLRRNDITFIAAAVATLIHPGPETDSNLLVGLGSALSYVKDPRAAQVVARLLHAANPSARRWATEALRNIGGEEVIGPLTEALEDTDDEVVWSAIMGLAEITGDLDHGPGAQEEFKGKEKENYVNYWRNWARARK